MRTPITIVAAGIAAFGAFKLKQRRDRLNSQADTTAPSADSAPTRSSSRDKL